jgi:hypothetical protein
MITPRERLRIFLLLSGIVCTISGVIINCASPAKDLEQMSYRFGAWKDGGVAGAVPKEVAPWLIAGGIILFVASFFSRDK